VRAERIRREIPRPAEENAGLWDDAKDGLGFDRARFRCAVKFPILVVISNRRSLPVRNLL
jgi:hypothetical protein